MKPETKEFYNDLADIFMRFFRPIVFTLLCVCFVTGFFRPDYLKEYLEAASAAPDWLYNIMTILVAGVATEKFSVKVCDIIDKVKK